MAKECKSGLKEALKILKGVEGISVIELTKKDIVRHQLVTRIVNAYEAYDKRQEEEHRKRVERQRRDALDNNNDEQELTIIDTGNFTEN